MYEENLKPKSHSSLSPSFLPRILLLLIISSYFSVSNDIFIIRNSELLSQVVTILSLC